MTTWMSRLKAEFIKEGGSVNGAHQDLWERLRASKHRVRFIWQVKAHLEKDRLRKDFF